MLLVQVTDHPILKLAESSNCIQHLEMSHCRQITDRSVEVRTPRLVHPRDGSQNRRNTFMFRKHNSVIATVVF